MGTSSTKYNKVGGIAIKLENYVIHAGNSVSGCIHIHLTQQLPPCELIFIFDGVEKTA